MSSVRLALLLLLLSLSACGQKGPLVLPDDAELVPPAMQPAEGEEEDEDDSEEGEADPR